MTVARLSAIAAAVIKPIRAHLTPQVIDGAKAAINFAYKSSPKIFLLHLFVVATAGLIPVLMLYLLKRVVDTVAAAVEDGLEQAIDTIVLLIVAFAIVALLNLLLRNLANFLRTMQARAVTDHMMGVLQKQVGRLALSHFENADFFDTFHRARIEAPTRPSSFVHHLFDFAQSAISLVGVIGFLMSYDALFAVLLVLSTTPIVGIRFRHSREMFVWNRQRAERQRKTEYLNDLLTQASTAKEVRLGGFGAFLQASFKEARALLRRELRKVLRRQTLIEVICQAGSVLVMCSLFYVVAVRTVMGTLTLGSLAMYVQAFQLAQGLIVTVMRGLGQLYEDVLFFSTVNELLLLPTADAGHDRNIRRKSIPEPMRRGLSLEGVCFSYPGTQRQILHDVSFTVSPGQVTAMVGASGSGKSSIIKLMCRLYDPTAGRILIDDQDIRESDLNDWWASLGVAFQDYARFELPAWQGVWFGEARKLPCPKALQQAVSASGSNEFIDQLPSGITSILGRHFHDGSELSLGQWQKMALARAFYGDHEIIILDEPTAALDADSERKLIHSLRQMARDKIVFVITHRYAVAREADCCLVLQDGRLVERGSDKELTAAGGAYARLFRDEVA